LSLSWVADLFEKNAIIYLPMYFDLALSLKIESKQNII
jgi:hypothetical protein